MRALRRVLGCILFLGALCLCPALSHAAAEGAPEDAAPSALAYTELAVGTDEELLQALEAAGDGDGQLLVLRVEGEIILEHRAVLPENVRISLGEGAALRIRTDSGKLECEGEIELDGGTLAVEEKGRLLLDGRLRMARGNLAVSGRLWCRRGSTVSDPDGEARVLIGAEGRVDLCAGADVDWKEIGNAGTVEAEDGFVPAEGFRVRQLSENAVCHGLALDKQSGVFAVRDLEALQTLAEKAQKGEPCTAVTTRTLRLREPLFLPAGLQLRIQSDVSIRDGGSLIAYGPVSFDGGQLRVHGGGEAFLPGLSAEDEANVLWEEDARRIAVTSLTVTPPDLAEYDLVSGQWRMLNGSLTPVAEDGRELPETPLSAEMLSPIEAGEIGEAPVGVAFAGVSVEDAFRVDCLRRVTPEEAAAQGLSLETTEEFANVYIVQRALDAEMNEAFLRAARTEAEKRGAELLRAESFDLSIEGLPEGAQPGPLALRIPAEEGESLLLLRVDGNGLNAAQMDWNGHSWSALLDGPGPMAVCALKEAEPAEAETPAPTETPAPAETLAPTETPKPTERPTETPTSTPGPTTAPTQTPEPTREAAETPIPVTTLTPSPSPAEIPAPAETAGLTLATPEAALLSMDGGEVPEGGQGYGLALGALFLLLVAAAALIAAGTGRRK